MHQSLYGQLALDSLFGRIFLIVTLPKLAEEHIEETDGVGVQITPKAPHRGHDECGLNPNGEVGHDVVVLSKSILEVNGHKHTK